MVRQHVMATRSAFVPRVRQELRRDVAAAPLAVPPRERGTPCPAGKEAVEKVAALAALLMIGALTATACGRGSAPAGGATAAREAVVEVATARAGWLPVTRQLRVTGSLTADEQAEVAAETAGRVIETPV